MKLSRSPYAIWPFLLVGGACGGGSATSPDAASGDVDAMPDAAPAPDTHLSADAPIPDAAPAVICAGDPAPHLWANVDTQQWHTEGPKYMQRAGERVTYLFGTELWVTDGTPDNTELVAPDVGEPDRLAVFGGRAFYLDRHPPEPTLYAVDVDQATVATVPLGREGAKYVDLWPTSSALGPLALVTVANDSTQPASAQLNVVRIIAGGAIPLQSSRTDFTNCPAEPGDGATDCTDLFQSSFAGALDTPNLGVASVVELGDLGEDLYFIDTWYTLVSGRPRLHLELWRVDRIDGRMHLVAERTGGYVSGPTAILRTATGVPHSLLFSVNSAATNQPELWATDGTDAGTGRKLGVDVVAAALQADGWIPTNATLSDVSEFSIGSVTALGNGAAVSVAVRGPDYGVEALLWYAGDGVSVLQAHSSGTDSFRTLPGAMATPEGLYITGMTDEDKPGLYAWSPGDAGPAGLLRTFVAPESEGAAPEGILLEGMAGGRMVFWAYAADQTFQLWSSGGTQETTQPIGGDWIAPRFSDAFGMLRGVTLGNALLFGANDGTGRELWSTEGLGTTTHKIVDAAPGDDGSLLETPRSFFTIGRDLYFWATSAGERHELWRSSQAVKPPKRVASWADQPFGSVVLGSQFFFTVNDGAHGTELWASDGTAENTRLFVDILPGGDGSEPSDLLAVGPQLFFSANDGEHGRELWTSDGTAAGTRMVADLTPGEDSSDPFLFAPVGDLVYFRIGQWLWRSDGTDAGTARLEPPSVEDPPYLFPSAVHAVGSRFVFSAEGPETGREFWTSDGTSAGTHVLKDICAGPCSNSISRVELLGGTGYYGAIDAAGTLGLWATDGTTDGTIAVATLVRTAAPGSGLLFLAKSDHLLLFEVDTDDDQSLYISDGTPAGTRMILPHRAVSSAVSLVQRNGAPVFVFATASFNGDGVIMIYDPAAGVAPSILRQPPGVDYDSLYSIGDAIFLRGRDATHGYEPWCLAPLR